ncbi:tRNA (adenosine(37)-N6)-threonylcarbamoyltransferase complex ATPase subunit type 1 TsaE [Sphingomonas sp. CFBP 13728]|uniref:tRNA (adenosine(37)-N6)-threonylcarbamoyltransferase complex ATPase subunit type 1 TsaE n=1 Tax=Sphingomonas sp. CFBP 13728 TaxID=2775294 RepID=UPI001FCE9CD6|nr:tRNA (adenosine(37)-N6)-threonylcarbamoyltransferase complex ATPase subunit type 1 TsaE [Sphingomonas sp. CFBP 13728]
MIRLPDPQATEAFGALLAERVRPGDVITLEGTLGAGKTSVARGLLAALGLAGEAPSPSFAIVQPYEPPEVRFPVVHVDLYRIYDPTEIEELALDDARYDSLLLVEWPGRAGPDYWPDALRLSLTIEPDGTRGLTIGVPEAWRSRWPT